MLFWIALRKELLEQWRTHRMLIVAAVLLLFGMASPLLAKYLPELLKAAIPAEQAEGLLGLIPTATAGDSADQYVKNTVQFGVLLALLMAMGTVAVEKDRGTAALMLVKPLPRWAFLLAKFAALGITFAGGIVLAGLASYLYTVLLFGAVSASAWLAMNALILLCLLVYVALTLLCSTLTRSQVVAAGLAFGVLILLALLSALPKVGDYVPTHLANWGVALVRGTGAAAWPAVWASLGLIAAALVGAWLVFERQEL
ncbi:MAG TPA: ABC transporter permease subunit [Anaerolineae bacterium]|nr:ABC transporter permease subunit [Anaerolineae bacterium]